MRQLTDELSLQIEIAMQNGLGVVCSVSVWPPESVIAILTFFCYAETFFSIKWITWPVISTSSYATTNMSFNFGTWSWVAKTLMQNQYDSGYVPHSNSCSFCSAGTCDASSHFVKSRYPYSFSLSEFVSMELPQRGIPFIPTKSPVNCLLATSGKEDMICSTPRLASLSTSLSQCHKSGHNLASTLGRRRHCPYSSAMRSL